MLWRGVDAGAIGDGGVQLGLSLLHAGPDVGTEGAHRRGQLPHRVADVLGGTRGSQLPDAGPRLATGRDPGSNS